MSVISRYIVSTYLRIIGLCAGCFIAIYLVIDFLEKIARFTRAGGKPLYILLFFLCKVPEIANQITPLAVLMATLLTLGMLSRHSEITAMRGCGISIARITAPILVTAFAISLFSFVLAEIVIPASFARMKYIQNVLIEKKSPNTFFRQQNIWYRQENTLLQARTFNPADQTLKGITIWQMGPTMTPVQRIEAGTAVFTHTGWLLKNVVIWAISGGNVAATVRKAELPV
ncbi:MAG TPA: LptF/LptG family permease, partial [Geobacteraceae bacterium]